MRSREDELVLAAPAGQRDGRLADDEAIVAVAARDAFEAGDRVRADLLPLRRSPGQIHDEVARRRRVIQGVVAFTAVEAIILRVKGGENCVVIRPGADFVGALSVPQDIVAGAAEQLVGVIAAGQRVGASTADHLLEAGDRILADVRSRR